MDGGLLEWIPRTFSAKHDLDDTDPITPGTCSGDTKMSKIHFNGSIMYFLGELAEMGYKDVAIYEPYPNLNDSEEVERATLHSYHTGTPYSINQSTGGEIS